MSEAKVYVVGGKEFELKPQTLRQRQLAAPVWNRILGIVKDLATVEDKKDVSVIDVLEVSLKMDDIVLNEDNSFAKFLATILSPSGKDWSPACVEENTSVMLDMDEVTQSEVLQDFLSRMANSRKGLPISTQISTSTTSKSPSNDK
jgi:hypothetical protein